MGFQDVFKNSFLEGFTSMGHFGRKDHGDLYGDLCPGLLHFPGLSADDPEGILFQGV